LHKCSGYKGIDWFYLPISKECFVGSKCATGSGKNRPEHIECNKPYGHKDGKVKVGPLSSTSYSNPDKYEHRDLHEWFKKYYGAANAILVIAGDIDVKTAKEKVEKYFGDIPPGPPVEHFQTWIAKRTGSQRDMVQDRVPQARLYKVWSIPEWRSPEADYLDLVSDVLALGKNSRLYKRLVYDEQIATRASAYVDLREIAGQFYIDVMAKPGEDLQKIEKIVNEELQRFLKEGPTEEELTRVKTQYMARFVRGIERIGGFGGKSDILAQNEVFAGDPVDTAELEQLPGTLRLSREGNRMRLYGEQPGRLATEVVRLAETKGLEIAHLCTHKPSLEDVFLYFTSDRAQELEQ